MTSARRSESLALTWSNVDMDAQTAYLPETKTDGHASSLSVAPWSTGCANCRGNLASGAPEQQANDR
jgi:hypothetical protein